MSAPRAQKRLCARGALLGASGRPLNFTVRGRERLSQVLYAAPVILFDGPYILLTALGVILFARYRNLPAAFVTVGFGLVVIGQIAGAFVNFEVATIYNSGGDTASAIATYRGWFWTLTRYGDTVGLWLGSVGVFWQLIGAKAGASSNKRWRGP